MEVHADRTLEFFSRISAIPRPPGKEERIGRWLMDWAAAAGFDGRRDAAGNVRVGVPASANHGHFPLVTLQSHMDMVCERTPDSTHDFSCDPIRPVVDGEWLHADRTTLGADNGIGMALSMDLASDPAVAHGPLELLFTVDEESGLTGAMTLSPDFVSGRVLINLDSEEEGGFTVGCAGGRKTRIAIDHPTAASDPSDLAMRLTVAGLRGGHSGIDINAGRASAIKVAARTLISCQWIAPLRLARLDGGTAHNAIPRDAEAIFICPAQTRSRCEEAVQALAVDLQREYAGSDTALRIELSAAPDPAGFPALTAAATRQTLQLLLGLPHGVAEMAGVLLPGLVRTSANLARVTLSGGHLEILSSQRSLSPSQLADICGRVEAVADLARASFQTDAGYPPWEPDLGSGLLACCQRVHGALFGQAARVEVLHAGLECAVIGSLYPGMEMVSCGPTMKHPHSPEERLHIPSVGRLRTFLAALLSTWGEVP